MTPSSEQSASSSKTSAKVGICMGSQSDWPTMEHAANVLDALGIAYEAKITSAHRTPKRMADYAETARQRGIKVIIAGAGGAAHLPRDDRLHDNIACLRRAC